MSLPNTYEKVKPAVVAFAMVHELPTETKFRIFGSGFCVDPTGIVVTARHVFTDYYEKLLTTTLPPSHVKGKSRKLPKSPDFRIIFFRREANRYGSVSCSVTGAFIPDQDKYPEDDVAAMRISTCPEYWGTQWPYLELGDSSKSREGDEVAISGYPLKWQPIGSTLPDLSKGIVSRIDAKFLTANRLEVAKLVLNITANPGNSGGPVFEVQSGKVIGLVSTERVRDQANIPSALKDLFHVPAGIIYCVPSQSIEKAISTLKHMEESA